MRVVLTVNFSPWSAYSGGGQRSTHQLGVALAGLGHDVTVVYTRPPWERVETPPGLPYRLRWAALPARSSRSDAWLRPATAISVAHQVRSLLGEGRTIVHGNGEEAALVPRLRAKGDLRLVVTPRYPSYPPEMQSGRWRHSVRALGLALTRSRYVALAAALAGADVCCPTSAVSAAEVQRVYGLDPAKIRVVPNGLAEEFARVERAADATGGPLVFFGRMSREKGVLTLVEALGRLGADAPRAVLVGRGGEEAAVRRRLLELGLADRVELRGWTDQAALARLLAGASLAVLPSFEESFGNAIAEAMAAGAPVVSTRVGAIPDFVTHDETGLLVAPDDETALAAAIRALLADPARAEALGAAGRAFVRGRYGWLATARTFVGVYEGLA